MSRTPRSNRVRDLLQHESRLRRGIATIIVLCLAGAIAAGAFVASAAVPAAPNNLLVFPNRDFVTVEGYTDHAGETALLEVTRGNTVIGSATATVSGGDVAFEVNHPGGVCWGNGTSLKVTPNILPGDKATVSFGGNAAGDAKVQEAFVTNVAYDGLKTVTITGRAKLDTGVDAGNVEQRIVNPDLVALIGKRDVRAVPGGPATAPKAGPAGTYSSNLVVDAATNGFTATYDFDSADVAKIVAEGGGERFLSWQVTDVAGNRQGVTIAELGEPGGPGIGGCPAGPNDLNPPAGTADWTQTGSEMTVNWNAVKSQPTAPAITDYSIDVIDLSSPGREHVGRRVAAGVRSATIAGLSPTGSYDVEVRAMVGSRMGDPFSKGATDTTPPTLTVTPAPGDTAATATGTDQVTLSSDDGQIYYTDNGQPAISGDGPSADAVPYRQAIPITGPTEIHAAAFDNAGNHMQRDGFYAPPSATPPPVVPPAAVKPAAPTGVTTTNGFHQVSLTWTTAPTADSYVVKAYDSAAATTPVATQSSTDTKATVTLTPTGKDYFFTVTAKNAAGDSDPSAQTTGRATDAVTIGTAKWKAGDFRITGTGTDVGTPPGTVGVYRDSTNEQIGTATVTMAPAVAPATGSTFDLRLRAGQAPAANPGKVYVKSSLGGRSASFATTG